MTATRATRKPIIGTAIYQRWNERDIAEDLKTVEFDATSILAGLDESERTRLVNDDYDIADSIFLEAVARGLIPAHDGPFTLHVYDLAETLEDDPEYFSAPFPEGREIRHEDTILETPLTPYEQGYRADVEGFVSGLVVVAMNDLHDKDFGGHLDNISKLLTGTELLQEIDSTAKAVTADGDVVMLVTGLVTGEFFDGEQLVEFEAGKAAGVAARVAAELV